MWCGLATLEKNGQSAMFAYADKHEYKKIVHERQVITPLLKLLLLKVYKETVSQFVKGIKRQ